MNTLLVLLIGFDVNDFILETFKLYLKDKGKIDDDELFETISELFKTNVKDYENEDTITFATLLIKLATTYMRFYPQKENLVFMLYKQFISPFNYLKNNEFSKKYFLEILTYIRSTGSIAQISPQSSEMLIHTSNRVFIEDKSRLFIAFASLMAQKEVLTIEQPIVIKCNSAVRILFEVMRNDSLDFILMLVNHSQRNRLACRIAELDIAILESIKNKSIDVKKGVEILMKISSEKSSASVVYSFLSLLVTPYIDVFMQNANILFTLLQDDKRTPLTYIPVDGKHSITHNVDNIQTGFTFITWILLDDSAETSFPSILRAYDMDGHLFDLFFSGKLPYISWGSNSKAGIEAARQKFQSQTWYFYALTYYIDSESIFVTININGQSIPAILISTENSVRGKVTFSFAKTQHVLSCPASLGPILLFEPLNEPDIQQIFGTGMENASNYKNRLLYSFTKSNKNITKPSSFVSILSKNVDTCVFLPMFIACDKTNDMKCFTISLQCLYEIVLSSNQAQKHFANVRGFEMFSILLQKMTNKNWINSVVYMQTYNVLQNLTNEKLKQQMIVSFLLNIDVWLLPNDEIDLLIVLKHWKKYLIPPYLLFYPTIFQFKIFLYALTKTVEKFKEKDLTSHVQVITDISKTLIFDLDGLKGVVSLLTSPEFRKYQNQLILMIFNGIKKIDKELIQTDEFLSILRTLFSLKIPIISDFSIFTLFSEDFKLSDEQFLNLLVDVVERDVSEKEFLEILDSNNSFWAVYYLLFRSKKSVQFLSLLLNKKNIKDDVSDLKKLVWICLSVFSENFETSDQMLKILSSTEDINWIFIFEMIGVVGSAIGINPEHYRSKFIQCLLEEELENGWKNILSFRKLSKRHFFCKTNWDIKSRPENVREFVANLNSIKDLTFYKNSQILSDDNLAEEIKKVDVYFMDELTKAISKPEELLKVLEVTSQINLKFTHKQKFQNLSLSEVINNSKSIIYENEFNQKMKSVTFIGAPFENFKELYKISEIEKLTSHGTTIGKPSEFIGNIFVLDEKNKKISVKLFMNDFFISITNDENYFKNFIIKLISIFTVFNDFVTISFRNGAYLKLIVDRQTIEKMTQRIPNLNDKTPDKFIEKIMLKWASNYLTNCELLWNLRIPQGIVEKPFVNKKGNLTFSAKNKDIISLTEMLQITNKFKDINEFISIVNSSQIFECKILSKPLTVKPINHFEGKIKIDPSKSVSIYGYKTINIVTGNRVYRIDFENTIIERSNSFPKRKWDYSISGSQVDFLYDGKLVSRIPFYCASICSYLCTNIDGCFVLIGTKNYVQILSSSGVIMNSISIQGIPDIITMTPHLNFVIVLSKDNDGSSSFFRLSSFTFEGNLINNIFLNSAVTLLYSFTDWNGRETVVVVTDGNEIMLIDALSMEKRTIYISKYKIVSFYYVKKYDCAVIVIATGKVVVIKL